MKVKSHKRIGKNKVSVVRSHSRKVATGHGTTYDASQFGGAKKKKPRKVTTSQGAKEYLFGKAKEVIHATGKAARRGTYVKGKTFTPNVKPKKTIIPPIVKKVFKNNPISHFTLNKTSNVGRIKGRNVAAKLIGRKQNIKRKK